MRSLASRSSLHFAGSLRSRAHSSLTNARPSAIYKVRGHLPPGVAPGTVANAPAQLGIEVATIGAVETAAQASAVQTGKGREVAQRVDVGMVAQKIVKNVSGAALQGAERCGGVG